MFGRHQPRATIIKLTAIGGLLSFITLLYFSTNPSYRSRLASSFFSERKRASCLPRAWSNGTWQHKPHNVSHPLTKQEDVFEFSDLEGCTSDREFYWHLGVDHDDQYERFPDVMDYEWVPSDECTGVRKMDAGMFVRDLVQEGGWLVLGGACFYQYLSILHWRVPKPNIGATQHLIAVVHEACLQRQNESLTYPV